MGMVSSKQERLKESVRRGDIALVRQLVDLGAKLNRASSGETALVVACSSPHLLHIAVELIGMGADVNYCDTENQRFTALQMATSQHLLQTVNLLLSHGANPLLHGFSDRNALEIAQDMGFVEIATGIEGKICYFCGWLRQFQDTLRVWEKIWVVVLPGDPSLTVNVAKLKIALYHYRHQAKPSKILSLRHCTLRRPDFSHRDPELILINNSIFSSGTPMKFRSGKVGDTEQMRLFYNACVGTTSRDYYSGETVQPAGMVASTAQEDSEMAAAISASIRTAIDDGIPLPAIELKGLHDMKASDHETLIKGQRISDASSSSCAICADNCADTACVPCGHLACCMACLEEVKRKKMGCPICRVPIERIMKVYKV